MEEKISAQPEFVAHLAATRMRTKFMRELSRLGLSSQVPERSVVTEQELTGLPLTVQRYLRFMGVVGQPRVASFRAQQVGTFRMGPDKPWLKCEAWQYNSNQPVTRIFHMRLRFGGVVPVYVRDTYAEGRGRMRGRVFDRFDIVDVADDKIDTGELVTYLNDAVLFAPSMLLRPHTTWTDVDDHCFEISLRDAGKTVSARVFIDKWGAPTNFSTSDRFGEDPAQPGTMVRTRWTTPISGFSVVDGYRVPTHGEAVWHFPSGDFTYAKFSLTSGGIAFNVPIEEPH